MASVLEDKVEEQFVRFVESMFGDFDSNLVYKENRNKVEYTLTVPDGMELKHAEDINSFASTFKDPFFCTIVWLDQNNKPYPEFEDILLSGNSICGISAWFNDITGRIWTDLIDYLVS